MFIEYTNIIQWVCVLNRVSSINKILSKDILNLILLDVNVV